MESNLTRVALRRSLALACRQDRTPRRAVLRAVASGMSAPALPRGVASGLGAAVLFGLSTPFAKLLLPSSGPFMLAGLLYLGAGMGLTVIAPFRRVGREAPLNRGDLPTLSEGSMHALGALAVAGASLAWSSASR